MKPVALVEHLKINFLSSCSHSVDGTLGLNCDSVLEVKLDGFLLTKLHSEDILTR